MMAALWESESSVWIVLSITADGIVCLAVASFELIRESLYAVDIIQKHAYQSDESHTGPAVGVCFVVKLYLTPVCSLPGSASQGRRGGSAAKTASGRRSRPGQRHAAEPRDELCVALFAVASLL